MQSPAQTVEQYLSELSPDRRSAITAVRQTILEHLPPGYEEVMAWGMITYQVPLATYPQTYNGRPLAYAGLASQKNHLAVYLMGIYVDAEAQRRFGEAYRATGRRYDAGRSCVRFRRLEDLPLELIGQSIASLSVEDFIALEAKSRSAAKAARAH
jgi:hypothetical protein